MQFESLMQFSQISYNNKIVLTEMFVTCRSTTAAPVPVARRANHLYTICLLFQPQFTECPPFVGAESESGG